MRGPAAFRRDLAAVGVAVESPWDLVGTRHADRAAVPVLVDWRGRADREVPADERARFQEGVVRSLAVREARGVAGPALLREFRRPKVAGTYRWVVGNSLEAVAADEIYDDLVTLVEERSYGADRQMVVLGLARTTKPGAIDVLVGQLDDDTVAGHAVMALGRLKAARARPAIEPLLRDGRPWVRREARKALARIDAAGRRSAPRG